MERPAERGREVAGPVDLVSPLHHPRCHAGEVAGQKRLCQQMTPVLLSCAHDDRRAGRPRVRQVPHRVPQAGGTVDVEERRPPCGLRVPVSHACRHRFVQSQHVAEPAVGRQGVDQRQLGGSGVTENVPDALGLQDLEQDLGS
jgi:hypothetical protein